MWIDEPVKHAYISTHAPTRGATATYGIYVQSYPKMGGLFININFLVIIIIKKINIFKITYCEPIGIFILSMVRTFYIITLFTKNVKY